MVRPMDGGALVVELLTPRVARLCLGSVGPCSCASLSAVLPGWGSSLPACLQPEVCQPEEPVGERWDK